MPITRQQQWARKAFECVHRCTTVDDRKAKREQEKYLTFAKQLPSLIHACGAVQALAFAQAKGSKEDGIRWVLADLNEVHRGSVNREVDALLDDTRKASLMAYLKLNRELIVVASWIKRYAEALLKGEN